MFKPDANERIAIDHLCMKMHGASRSRGWWDDLDSVLSYLPKELHPKVRFWFESTKITLIHSEVTEMFEALRKNKVDDHIPTREGAEVECADILIRLLDLAGQKHWDLSGAMLDKVEYNAMRADHDPENRNAPGGKLA